jgi:Leucine-rich repeat (LRR) protein
MSYLSPSEHRIWTRYLSMDKLRQYRRILETTPAMKRFSIHGGGSINAVDDETNDEQIMELVTTLCLYQGGDQSSLEEFTIEFFSFSQLGWNALSNALHAIRNLKRLYLRHVHVKNEDGRTMPVYLVKNLLHKCPSLEHLDLVDCHLNAMAAQNLAQQLLSKSSRKLKILSLEGNSIGNVGVKLLAQALELNTTLTALDIDRNGCSIDAWMALSESLKTNKSLQALSCCGNGGLEAMVSWTSSKTKDNEGGRWKSPVACQHPFEELLLINRTVTMIQPPRITSQIEFYLRLNRAGRKWIGEHVMNHIFHLLLHRVCDDPDVIYYFLKAQAATFF